MAMNQLTSRARGAELWLERNGREQAENKTNAHQRHLENRNRRGLLFNRRFWATASVLGGPDGEAQL